MVEAYPLQWPSGWERTSYRKSSRFNTTFAVARDELIREITRLGGKSIVISTNVELRGDGLPYANRRQPQDVGVAVYFAYKGQPQCFPCDRWDRIEDNMHAICLTVAALRGIERWGSGRMMQAAFTGFKSLPSAEWSKVLSCSPNSTNEQVQFRYRELARKYHPDVGGSHHQMAEINRAYDAFKKERGIA